jgi:hypothetical protein
MKVSIHLTKNTGPAGAGKEVVLRDLDLDTALSISTALNGVERADVESLIVIEEPRGRAWKLPAWLRNAWPAHGGWFHRLRPRLVAAVPRVSS